MSKQGPVQTCLLNARTTTLEMFTERWPGHYFFGHWPRTGRLETNLPYKTGLIDVDLQKLERLEKEAQTKGLDALSDCRPGEIFLLEIKIPNQSSRIKSVSIGRAGSNGLILRHSSVSKLHARIDIDEGSEGDEMTAGQCWLTDFDSTLGTRINGSPLAPSESRLIKSGDFVVFGRVGGVFLDSAGLYERLRLQGAIPGVLT